MIARMAIATIIVAECYSYCNKERMSSISMVFGLASIQNTCKSQLFVAKLVTNLSKPFTSKANLQRWLKLIGL